MVNFINVIIVKWMTIEFIMKSRSFLYYQEWVLLFNWCCFCCALSHPALPLFPLLWFTAGRGGGGGRGCSSWSSVLIFGVNGALFSGSMVPFLPFFFLIFGPTAYAGPLGGWCVGFEAERPSVETMCLLYTCCDFSCSRNEMLLWLRLLQSWLRKFLVRYPACI